MCNDNVKAAETAQIVIPAFPPQNLHHVLSASGMADASKGKLIISIIAGNSCEQIQDVLQASGTSDSKSGETA